jgi:hypothetical protein
MNRTHGILLGVLAVQVLLILLGGSFFGGSAEAGARQALLPALADLAPTRLQITEGEEASVVLEKAGDAWSLADVDGYPVDSAQVDTVIDALKDVRVGAPVVTSSRYHEALEVTDGKHQRRVRMWQDGSGDPDVDVYLGSSPNYQVTHVRVGGADEVYEARGVNAYDFRTDASAWVERKFVDVVYEDVTGLSVKNTHGAIDLEKTDDGWRSTAPLPAGESLDVDAVDSAVRSLVSLWLSEPAGRVDPAAHGFDPPAATVELRYSVPDPEAAPDEAEPPTRAETLVLTVGGEVEGGEGKRYATRSGFDWSVALSKYDAERVIEQKLADLFVGADESGE